MVTVCTFMVGGAAPHPGGVQDHFSWPKARPWVKNRPGSTKWLCMLSRAAKFMKFMCALIYIEDFMGSTIHALIYIEDFMGS